MTRCPLCNDSGFQLTLHEGHEVVRRCPCQKEKRILNALQRANIPKRFWGGTLLKNGREGKRKVDPWSGQIKDIRGTDNDTFASQAKMQKICRERYELYLHHAEKDQREVPLPGLLVSGAVGIGKTHWLATLLVDLVHDGLTRVAFVEASELMKRLQFSYQKREEQTEQAILNELATASVLVLDDLGSYGSDNVEWIQNTLRYIFNRRYNDNLPTLISTNYPLRAKEGERRLSDVLEQRLLSRLMEMCDLVTMKGLDYRQEHAREL